MHHSAMHKVHCTVTQMCWFRRNSGLNWMARRSLLYYVVPAICLVFIGSVASAEWKSPYDVLGLDKSATSSAVRKAYRKLAL